MGGLLPFRGRNTYFCVPDRHCPPHTPSPDRYILRNRRKEGPKGGRNEGTKERRNEETKETKKRRNESKVKGGGETLPRIDWFFWLRLLFYLSLCLSLCLSISLPFFQPTHTPTHTPTPLLQISLQLSYTSFLRSNADTRRHAACVFFFFFFFLKSFLYFHTVFSPPFFCTHKPSRKSKSSFHKNAFLDLVVALVITFCSLTPE